VVGELNYGGAMVEAVIQTARPGTPYKGVTASRGKHLRAEPIAALFETGKVKLAGNFPDLEDEMCAMSTAGYTGVRSPNRLDAMVMAVTELFPSLTKVKKEPAKRKHIPRSRSRGSAWMGA
jgi:phage terminase large subunit-like protein